MMPKNAVQEDFETVLFRSTNCNRTEQWTTAEKPWNLNKQALSYKHRYFIKCQQSFNILEKQHVEKIELIPSYSL